ncbi:MAG: hypothetical protein ACI9XR_001063 [Flavobacterium sp.]|jgi:hypothetical protein
MFFIATATFAKTGEITSTQTKALPVEICKDSNAIDEDGVVVLSTRCCATYQQAPQGAALVATHVLLQTCADNQRDTLLGIN